jgi:HlyD family secretion protein
MNLRSLFWNYTAWRVLKLLLVVLVAGGAIAYFAWSPVAVTAHTLQRGDIVAEVMGTGTLEARVKSTISPKISGRIKEILADQGQRVKAGQTLVRLDDEDLMQQVEIARAGVATSQAGVERLKADKDNAVAVAKQAEQDYNRVKKLVSANAVSGSDFDKSAETLATAKATLAHADAAIVEAQQQLVSSEKTLKYQQAQLSNTVILAPFDGLIVRRQRDPGDVVVTGSPILLLVSTNVLWISAWIDETEMGHVHEGQSARVVFRSGPETSYAGRVIRLGREADRETRECLVDVCVLTLPKNWAVGQRAEVYIETDRKQATTLLPPRFVVWRDTRPGVFVDSKGEAVWRDLTLGLHGQTAVEVVEGLKPGEIVIAPVDAETKLETGQRITIK